MRVTLALLSACSLFLSACAPSSHDADRVEHVVSPVIGGQLAEPGDLNAALQLPDALCSAVMISPRHVLTAGHCVEREPGTMLVPDDALSVRWFGAQDIAGYWFNVQTHIAARHIHPLWHDRLAALVDPDAVADLPDSVDLGIYTLEDDLAIPAAALSVESPKPTDHQILVTGSGCESRQGSSLGRPKLAAVELQDVQTGRLIVGMKGKGPHAVDEPVGLCSGDSGGGGYLLDASGAPLRDASGSPLLAGINSTLVPDGPLDDAPTPGVLVRLDNPVARDWILDILKREARPPQALYQFGKIPVELATLGALQRLRAEGDRAGIQKRMSEDPFLMPLIDAALADAVTDALLSSTQAGRATHEVIDDGFRRFAGMDPTLWGYLESTRTAVMHPLQLERTLIFYLKFDPRFRDATAERLRAIAAALVAQSESVPAVLKTMAAP